MKRIIILLVGVIVLLAGVVAYFFIGNDEITPPANTNTPTLTATSTVETDTDDTRTVLGTSVEGQEIIAYHYGQGDTDVLFVGGIHGGYAWNTALLAYELMEELESNPDMIPDNVRVTVIPVLNPDGLSSITGTSSKFVLDDVEGTTEQRAAARLNANTVDLNRNFDCDWQSEGTWQSRTVSGGSRAFSEPESQAFRDYISANRPEAVVVWYSAAGGVFASSCHNDVLADTAALTNAYADASGYRAYENFDFYEITGDMVNWLARERIPAISVLLRTHEEIDWEENQLGVQAVLNYFVSNQ